MKIFPAIDLRGGRCVRLRQGRAEDETVYSDDPVRMALSWQDQGAEFLHVVDLDGAFAGRPVHTDLFRELAAALRIPFEVGGGLRTDDDVRAVLEAGAARAILGSRAVSDPDCVARLAAAFGRDRIVAGIDARDGLVQVAGWTETTRTRAVDFAADLAARGAGTFIYTDTATDGMMPGPNLAAMAAMADAVAPAGGSLVASGGVHAPSAAAALAALGRPNLEGAIVGKARYEKAATLAAFLAAARETPSGSLRSPAPPAGEPGPAAAEGGGK